MTLEKSRVTVLTTLTDDKTEQWQKTWQNNGENIELVFFTIRQIHLTLKTGEIYRQFTEGTAEIRGDAVKTENDIFLIFTTVNTTAMQTVDIIKKNDGKYRSAIFAMITETAAEWTLERYLTELLSEHKQMRANC